MSEAPATVRPYHHGDLPSALLDAVDALIREEGLSAVSLRAAARRAGVSHAAPAHHFTDKAGLLAAFAQQGFAAFTVTLERARSTAGTREEQLRAMGHAYVAFAREHRPWFEVMFRPELTAGHRDAVHHSGEPSFRVLADHVAACLADTASEDDVLGLTLSAWSAVHGFAHLSSDGPLDELGLPAEAVEPVLDVLLAGLRAHPLWIGDGA